MTSPAKQVELLDYLRGAAILSVLLVHTLGTTFGYDELPWGGLFRHSSTTTSFLWFLPVSVLALGVPIFFVVSGFCIHLSFLNSGQKWGAFFIRRFFRIYPAYFAALIFFTAINLTYSRGELLNYQEYWWQLLTHLWLGHNVDPASFSAINGAFWSLAIEAQLYLLYPLLLGFIARLGWQRTMIAVAVVEVSIRGVAGVTQTFGFNSPGGINFSNSPFGYWYSWAMGAYLAEAFAKKQPLPFAKYSPVFWLALGIGVYFIKPLFPFRFLLFAVATAVYISGRLSRAAEPTAPPSVLLNPLKKIGLWSYSIYLLHEPLINIYSHLTDRLIPGAYDSPPFRFFFVALTWAVIIPFSMVWYHGLEVPAIGWGKKIISLASSRLAPAAPSPGGAGNAPVKVTRARYIQRLVALLLFIGGTLLIVIKLSPSTK
jgi:peptidoglycan/LPS O-acetylase OafA/YrhL